MCAGVLSLAFSFDMIDAVLSVRDGIQCYPSTMNSEHLCQALAGFALSSMQLSVADLGYVGMSAAAMAILSAIKKKISL